MPTVTIPKLLKVRQLFPASTPLAIDPSIRREFETSRVLSRLRSGSRIAVAVGSRGISNLPVIVRSTIDCLKAAGAEPFLIPAMGSHGGATPEGQRGILEEYGVSEKAMGGPIRDSLDVERVGTTAEGVEVFCSVEALRADGVVIINRIKPHTDFQGTLGSGVIKMIVIGLGKRAGAAACHAAASRMGYERAIRSIAEVILRSAPILCGVGIVENQFHDTAKVVVLKPDELTVREAALLEEARQLMPRLPVGDIDLLIVDRIGKNISGSGMDPNVTGRWPSVGANPAKPEKNTDPTIRRIFVRGLTAETHGNAIGIGSADMTTTGLVASMDQRITYINALTALHPESAKIPVHFDNDRECIEHALASLAISDTRHAKVIRIADTLSLARIEMSEAYTGTIRQRADLEELEGAQEIRFDEGNNLESIS
jgi:hypothetical protein